MMDPVTAGLLLAAFVIVTIALALSGGLPDPLVRALLYLKRSERSLKTERIGRR